jgi:hypothetical protein
MVALLTAAFFFGAFLGRFLTVFVLVPTCCLLIVLALLLTSEPILRIIGLIVSLQLGYGMGLVSRDIITILKRRRCVRKDDICKQPPPSRQ